MNCKYIAKNNNPHHIDFDEKYPTWGKAGSDAIHSASENVISAAKTTLQDKIPIGFKFSSAYNVSHYQGPTFDPVDAILVRFTPNGNINIGSEHISAVLSLDDYCILGYCKMIKECVGSAHEQLDPQKALRSAFSFLKQEAADLVTIDQCPTFQYPNDYKGVGVDFSDNPIDLGAVSLYWIDAHFEKFHDNLSKQETCGMKVKMRFNDDSERYAWVIIDKEGKVHVFERNIFWDFANMQRQTQMWLHDGWLKVNKIIMP